MSDLYMQKQDLFARLFYALLKHKAAIIVAFVSFLAILAFRSLIMNVFWLFILAFIGSFSTYYKRVTRVPPAIELITFGTVMSGIAFGPVVGAAFGIVVTLLAEILNSGLDFFIVGYVPARAAVGIASGVFSDAAIIPLGLSMSLLYNLIAQPLYAFQSDAELRFKLLVFVLVNVSFNFIAFSLFGPLFKGIIT